TFPSGKTAGPCGEGFAGSPMVPDAQRGWPNAKFSTGGGGGGSGFPSSITGLTTPDVAQMRLDLDNGSSAMVTTIALPAQYPYRAYVVFLADYGYPKSAGAEHVNQFVALDDQGHELAKFDSAALRRCPDG